MGNCLGKSRAWDNTIVSLKKGELLSSSERTDETGQSKPSGRRDNESSPLNLSSSVVSQGNNSSEQLQDPERPVVPYLPSDIDFTSSCNTRIAWRVENIYQMGEVLGRGCFGSVYAGTHRFASKSKNASSETEWTNVAIKQTEPNALDRRSGNAMRTPDDLENHCQEIKALLRLQEGSAITSRVLHLYEYFMSKTADVYLVTERLGQELDDWKAHCDVFTERMAIEISRTVLQSIAFCASRGVVHRDVKMNNIMFRINGNFRTLKLVDFGLARVLKEDESVKDFCGSIGHIAPEIYNRRSYRFEVDLFAFGVVLFRLLSGERPFPATDEEILKRDTTELRYSVQGSDWEGVSSAAKDLIRKLLIHHHERLTAEQALAHPWFKEVGASVLRPDFSCSLENPEEEVRSKAFLLSRSTSCSVYESVTSSDESRFWIDSSTQVALATIISQNIYSGRQIENKVSRPEMIFFEEIESSIKCSVTKYVSRSRPYTELDCRTIFRAIVLVVQKLHAAGIAHRHLHTGNVLLDPFGDVSVQGMHYAQLIQDNQALTGRVGKDFSWYAFKAPEVDREFVHDKSVDLWSLGAILYVISTGVAPFRGNGVELMGAKHAGFFEFDLVVPSAKMQSLIRGLLIPDPRDRLSLEEVLNHEWMMDDDDYLKKTDLSLASETLRYWV